MPTARYRYPGNGSATAGVLSGILSARDAVAWATTAAGWSGTSLCSGSALASITQVEQTSDIMADGSNGPGQTCDAISVGFGFDATAVQLGAVAPSPTYPPTPCGGK